jgi:hypothetical protein
MDLRILADFKKTIKVSIFEVFIWKRGRAMLPRSEPLPTTTTGHYTICCKKSQSCAPEDGQKFA